MLPLSLILVERVKVDILPLLKAAYYSLYSKGVLTFGDMNNRSHNIIQKEESEPKHSKK